MAGRSASQTSAQQRFPLALLFVLNKPFKTWSFKSSLHYFKAELSHWHPHQKLPHGVIKAFSWKWLQESSQTSLKTDLEVKPLLAGSPKLAGQLLWSHLKTAEVSSPVVALLVGAGWELNWAPSGEELLGPTGSSVWQCGARRCQCAAQLPETLLPALVRAGGFQVKSLKTVFLSQVNLHFILNYLQSL